MNLLEELITPQAAKIGDILPSKKLFNKIIKITYKFLILFSYPISMKNYENFFKQSLLLD